MCIRDRCRPGATLDDGLRCVPETNVDSPTTFYADPACTEPVVGMLPAPAPGCAPLEPSRYVPRYADAGCGTLAVTEVWERSEASEELTVFHVGGQGTCNETGTAQVYRVIAVHPASSLAPLAVVVLDG